MAGFFTSRLFFVSLALVIVAATLPLYVSGYVLGLLTVAFYFGVFAMAWDLLFGFAGEVNFGPTFLIGVGAYTAGILDNLYQPPIWLCIAAGFAAARAVFRPDHARRCAHPAEFHRGRCAPHRRRDRTDRAGRDFDQRHHKLSDRAVVHGDQRRDPVLAVALAGRPHPAGERSGRSAGRRARLQRH